MLQELQFNIPTRAVPGSNKKKAYVVNGVARVVDKSKGKDKLFATVRVAADRAVEVSGWKLSTTAIYLEITFTFTRPKKHFGTGKNSRTLKPSAPKSFPINKSCGDGTNLIKSVEDALTGIIWKDDSQVASTRAIKTYGETDRIAIYVLEMAN